MKKDRKTELRVAIRELVTNKRRAFELNTNREVTFQEFKLYKDIYKNIEMRKIDWMTYYVRVDYHYLPAKEITFISINKAAVVDNKPPQIEPASPRRPWGVMRPDQIDLTTFAKAELDLLLNHYLELVRRVNDANELKKSQQLLKLDHN